VFVVCGSGFASPDFIRILKMAAMGTGELPRRTYADAQVQQQVTRGAQRPAPYANTQLEGGSQQHLSFVGNRGGQYGHPHPSQQRQSSGNSTFSVMGVTVPNPGKPSSIAASTVCVYGKRDVSYN
jgi:hypothetical protein